MGKLKKPLEKKKITNTLKLPYECPHCNWILRQEKPDEQHPIPSTTKPYENVVSRDILIQKIICRNPRCQKSFVVYWSKFKGFYNRI